MYTLTNCIINYILQTIKVLNTNLHALRMILKLTNAMQCISGHNFPQSTTQKFSSCEIKG